ncbi:MAG TPA: rhomboid family intramembrane serine protease [Solirubrobacteraceae bacterium]|nr:rhomboid family intramembrane serine protease [Solirubrobacteraceae bacterium]
MPREGLPLATLALGLLVAIAHLAAGAHELAWLALDLLALAVLGPSVESSLGRARLLALCLLAGALCLGARGLLGEGSPAPLLFAATGALAAVLGAHLLLYPRARVASLAPIPFHFTIVEIPSALLLALWLLAQLALAAAGLESDLGASPAPHLAHLGGFAAGALLVWPLAHRVRRPLPPRLPVY